MKQKKGIRRKILLHTLIVVMVLAGILVGVMSYFMASLTDTILMDTLQPMARTAAQSVEGNLHMLADRLFLIRDNTVFTDEKPQKRINWPPLNGQRAVLSLFGLAYTPLMASFIPAVMKAQKTLPIARCSPICKKPKIW